MPVTKAAFGQPNADLETNAVSCRATMVILAGGRMKKPLSRIVQTVAWLTAIGSLGLACGSTDSTVEQQNGQSDGGGGTSGGSSTGGGTVDGSAGTISGRGGSVATGGSAGTSGAAGARHDAAVSVPPADAPFACGSETCAPDEWCQYPCCGILPPCMPGPEGGTCAVGYKSCFTMQGVQGCQYSCSIPSCSKQAPQPDCTINGRQVHCMCA